MFVLNSDLIKEKMDSKNLNQTAFSELLGMTSQNFSYMINNKSKSINLEVAHKISKLLDLSISDLIIDDEQSPQDLLNEIYYLTDKLARITKQHQELSKQQSKPATQIFENYNKNQNKAKNKAQNTLWDHFPMKQSEVEKMSYKKKFDLQESMNHKASKITGLSANPTYINQIIYFLQCMRDDNPVEIDHLNNDIINRLLEEFKNDVDRYFRDDPIKHKISYIDSIIQAIQK